MVVFVLDYFGGTFQQRLINPKHKTLMVCAHGWQGQL
jgi:hypothetical protein